METFVKQELNITPKPAKNKTKEALKATQAKKEKQAKKAKEAEEANKAKKARRQYSRVSIKCYA